MSNLLQQLENDQAALLLMHLSGELADADRAEVDRRLAADPALRAALADLAALQDDVTAAFSAADAVREPARCDAAVRAVSRAIVAAELRPAPSEARPGRHRHVAWWAYPVAAAAMLVIGMVLYTRSTPSKVTPDEPNKQVVIVIPVIPEVVPPAPTASIAQIESDVSSLQSSERSVLGDLDPTDLDR